MIIALVHYDAPLEEVDRIVTEHRAYLAQYYAEKRSSFPVAKTRRSAA